MVPVERSMAPLRPVVPALAVDIVKAPVVEDVESPAVSVSAPPIWPVAVVKPAVSVKSPPAPLLPSPTVMAIAPPRPPLANPD